MFTFHFNRERERYVSWCVRIMSGHSVLMESVSADALTRRSALSILHMCTSLPHRQHRLSGCRAWARAAPDLLCACFANIFVGKTISSFISKVGRGGLALLLMGPLGWGAGGLFFFSQEAGPELPSVLTWQLIIVLGRESICDAGGCLTLYWTSRGVGGCLPESWSGSP